MESSSKQRQCSVEPPRILVVDDDERVAGLLARVLGGTSNVDVATDATVAVERLVDERFDAVLCDLHMPKLSGRQVYERVADENPERARRMIFVTGGGFSREVQQFLDEIENPLLYKPMDFGQLASTIGEVMGRPFEL